jgi:hypothetical protein
MSKNRFTPTSGKPPSQSTPRAAGSLPAFVRLVISLLLAWHLTAVFLATWSVPPTSPLVARLAQCAPMRWYLDALYLDRGSQLLLPDAGEGHLIRYQVLDNRGSVIHEGELPSKKDQWPRLRYHRYFMLAEQAGLPLPEEADRAYWQRVYLQNYARQLLRQYTDGAMVRLQRIAHYPLFPEHALEGRKLDDRETYKTVQEVVQRRSDLGPGAGGQEMAVRDEWGRPVYDRRQDVAGRSRWQGGVR